MTEPTIDIGELQKELQDAKDKLDKLDPSLKSSVETVNILKQMKKIKDELKKADPVEHEELRIILKCECGKTMDIPEDLQTKMDAEEDIAGSLPSCDCGKTYHISVVNL